MCFSFSFATHNVSLIYHTDHCPMWKMFWYIRDCSDMDKIYHTLLLLMTWWYIECWDWYALIYQDHGLKLIYCLTTAAKWKASPCLCNVSPTLTMVTLLVGVIYPSQQSLGAQSVRAPIYPLGMPSSVIYLAWQLAVLSAYGVIYPARWLLDNSHSDISATLCINSIGRVMSSRFSVFVLSPASRACSTEPSN